MRAVNLLPTDAYAPRQRLPYAPIVLAATVPVFAAALVYLGYSFEHAKVTDKQLTLGSVQSEIAALGPSPALVSQAGRVAGERAARETQLADALSKSIPWDRTLDQISRVLPANAWLSTLSLASPTPAGTAAPAAPAAGSTTTTTSTSTSTAAARPSVSIAGVAYSQADVARVLARLALVPALSNVTLTSTAQTQIGEKQVIQFSITAFLRGSGS